jgi:hypothetical protein
VIKSFIPQNWQLKYQPGCGGSCVPSTPEKTQDAISDYSEGGKIKVGIKIKERRINRRKEGW